MTDNTSTMTTTNPPTTDQIKALQTMEKSIRSLLASFGVDGAMAVPSTKKGRGRTKKNAASADAAPSDGTAKPKREINPKIAEMNVERKAIYAEMVDAWKSANTAYASLSKTDLAKAVADGKVSKPPSYPDALKEHSRRLNEREPERATKRAAAAERKSKTDDSSSAQSKPAAVSDAASTATDATATTKKRRGPKPLSEMTPAERAAHDAKVAARKNAKTAAPAPAPAPEPAPEPAVVAKSTAPEIITGDDDDPETLKPWSFEGTDYFKNDLGYVYEMTAPDEPGAYVGRYSVKKGRKYIDTSAPEPVDA